MCMLIKKNWPLITEFLKLKIRIKILAISTNNFILKDNLFLKTFYKKILFL